jgi:hypothetical protein
MVKNLQLYQSNQECGGVIRLGYVGSPLFLSFVQAGYSLIGFTIALFDLVCGSLAIPQTLQKHCEI